MNKSKPPCNPQKPTVSGEKVQKRESTVLHGVFGGCVDVCGVSGVLGGPQDVLHGGAVGAGARLGGVREGQPRRVDNAVVTHQRHGHLEDKIE